MHNIKELESDVNFVRKNYIDYIQNLNNDQGNFKPSPEAWSVAEITEHLVYTEYGGICGLYSALNKYRKGIKTWEGPNPNLNLNIEEIISRTWKGKEIAPDPASPRMGLALELWRNALEANQLVLQKLTEELEGLNYDEIIQPHPISGPMNVWQRYQFLRFHIERHHRQVERLCEDPRFKKP